uniref:Uncharacterized protein n=1 Tax=Vespula pensylvanica TaxID=30213 RepID=A0A834UAD7_VESPE|nr:hypothetical protein H0235_008302 [Vespula pensylvanica]
MNLQCAKLTQHGTLQLDNSTFQASLRNLREEYRERPFFLFFSSLSSLFQLSGMRKILPQLLQVEGV